MVRGIWQYLLVGSLLLFIASPPVHAAPSQTRLTFNASSEASQGTETLRDGILVHGDRYEILKSDARCYDPEVLIIGDKDDCKVENGVLRMSCKQSVLPNTGFCQLKLGLYGQRVKSISIVFTDKSAYMGLVDGPEVELTASAIGTWTITMPPVTSRTWRGPLNGEVASDRTLRPRFRDGTFPTNLTPRQQGEEAKLETICINAEGYDEVEIQEIVITWP